MIPHGVKLSSRFTESGAFRRGGHGIADMPSKEIEPARHRAARFAAGNNTWSGQFSHFLGHGLLRHIAVAAGPSGSDPAVPADPLYRGRTVAAGPAVGIAAVAAGSVGSAGSLPAEPPGVGRTAGAACAEGLLVTRAHPAQPRRVVRPLHVLHMTLHTDFVQSVNARPA